MKFLRRSKGGVRPEDEDPNRDALFGNRRAAGHPPSANNNNNNNNNNNGYRSDSNAITNPYAPERGGHGGDGYGDPQSGYGRGNSEFGDRGGYGDANPYDYSRRQYPNEPSAGSNSDEEVDVIKRDIKFKNEQTKTSLQNALDVAVRTEQSGVATLNRLADQGHQLTNIDDNLAKAEIMGRAARDQTSELEQYNGSMFVPRFGGARGSSARAAKEANALASHRNDREEREITRGFGYESKKRVGRALNDTGRVESGAATSSAQTSKYQFEADESDEEREKVIANNLDQLGAITGRLKGLAMATGAEVDQQNVQIERIMKKSDRVDDQIAVTHNKLRKIH